MGRTMTSRLRDPRIRLRLAMALGLCSLIGWPATHIAILIQHPAGTDGWVFHLLLALSWLAITLTAADIVATTDVRKEQDGDA